MSLEIKMEISCFTADFRNGKVTVGGKTFPSGYFFVNSMNEYWKPYNDDIDKLRFLFENFYLTHIRNNTN